MMIAFVFSSLFLVSYIINHALHGDTIFPNVGMVKTVYLWILFSHITLSIVALPMVLTTFFFSLSGRFRQHRKLARFTLPIWLYVSVTGVVVHTMLAHGGKLMPDDGTRQLLQAGIWILLVGGVAALLTASFWRHRRARSAHQLRLAHVAAGYDVPALRRHADAAGSGQMAAQSPLGTGTGSSEEMNSVSIKVFS